MKSVLTAGGSQNDAFLSVKSTTDGGFVAAGFSKSADGDLSGSGINSVGSNMFIQKYKLVDGTLVKEWQDCMGSGNGSYNQFTAVIQTNDGGYLAVGSTMQDTDRLLGKNHGQMDAMAVRYDQNGHFLWAQTLGGSKTDYATGVAQAADGGYIISGYSMSSDADFAATGSFTKAYLARINEKQTGNGFTPSVQ